MYCGPRCISLASSITISGDAASPNIGYHSSPFATFILTLLNVRLGARLGNPGQSGDHTFQLGYPERSVQPIIDQALGPNERQKSTRVSLQWRPFRKPWTLRNGAAPLPFDRNQRRRLACQRSFADVGESVRKIRVDFGIPIDFDAVNFVPAAKSMRRNSRAISALLARIRHSAVRRLHHSEYHYRLHQV